MKKTTRIARRIERETLEKHMQEEREKMQNLYNQRLKEKKAKGRSDLYKSIFKFFVWSAVVIIPIGIIMHYDNIEAEKRQNLLNVKLTAWNNYKDKNCQVVEKIFGMQMGSGKFTYVDDGNIYKCTNGLKYTLSNKAAKGDMGIDSIPDIVK